MNIVELSIKRPLIVFVLFTVLTLGGIGTFSMLNLNLLPKFELPMLTISTIYPGAGASEVETSVTKKIEDALSTLENLKKISSTSQEGISIISIELNEGTDANLSIQDAQRKINAIRSDLPTEVKEPSITKVSIDELPIMNVAVTSNLPASAFYDLLDKRIKPEIAKLQGVGAIKIVGGTEREIKVNIDIEKLRAYNLSILQVLQAIQTANMEIPAGNIESTKSVYSVRLAAKFSSLDQLRNTIITTSTDGGKIKVLDVAEVVDGVAKQEYINRFNGKEAIGISIQKQTDANAVAVADLAKAQFAAMEKEYTSQGVKFEIATDDSLFTKASAYAVVIDLLLAVLIVAIVCFIFLHNIRSALIVMVAVPLSIVPAFIAMYALGYSLNMMSLMALSLVVGILVDDSIVVIENMFRHMEKGKERRQAVIDGCKQIMFTAVAITFVIVVVFLPLAISGGLIGNVLKEFAIPIIVATLCSLLVSFTITPVLMARFGKLSDDTKPTLSARFSRFVEKTFESLKVWYVNVLALGLRHKTSILMVTLSFLIASFMLFPAGLIGFAFIPNIDEGEFTVSIEMNPQVTIYQNNMYVMEAERIIKQKKEVVNVYTNIGSSANMSEGSGKNNVTSISVKMVDKKDRNIGVEAFSEEVKNEIMQIPGIRARANIKSIAGAGQDPIQLIVQGTDLPQVQETAAMILNVMRETAGIRDPKYSIDDPRQEVQIKLNREKMSQLGLTASDVGSTLRVALNGNNDSKYSQGEFEYDINVRADGFDRTKQEDVSKLTFMNNKGEMIELQQIADVSYGLGPSTLERTDRISSITVKANVAGRPTGTVGAEIKAAIQGKIPQGITISEGGEMEQQGSAFSTLAIAFFAAIILIYLIMVVLYNSLLDPFVVLFSIPLSFVGALLALALTMNSLNIFSIIGLIVLVGLVAKNAILLVDFTNHMKRDKGFNTFDALVEAGKERLRPILMTTFAMIFGMLPIALASGHGAELKNGMAWVIIGGLASSMILTLIVVPVVYYIFDKVRNRSRQNISTSND